MPNSLISSRIKSIQKQNIDKIKQSKTKRKGIVYFLKSGVYYKIGKTINLSARLNSIKTGNIEIELIHKLENNDVDYWEKFFHKYFAHKRVNREWFHLDENDIVYIKDFICPV